VEYPFLNVAYKIYVNLKLGTILLIFLICSIWFRPSDVLWLYPELQSSSCVLGPDSVWFGEGSGGEGEETGSMLTLFQHLIHVTLLSVMRMNCCLMVSLFLLPTPTTYQKFLTTWFHVFGEKVRSWNSSAFHRFESIAARFRYFVNFKYDQLENCARYLIDMR